MQAHDLFRYGFYIEYARGIHTVVNKHSICNNSSYSIIRPVVNDMYTNALDAAHTWKVLINLILSKKKSILIYDSNNTNGMKYKCIDFCLAFISHFTQIKRITT